MKYSNYYRTFPKILAVGIALSLGGYLGERLNNKKIDTRPLADPASEVKEYSTFSTTHNAFNGLYLTIRESNRREDNARQITFFDYGFDGKLDRVKILQDRKREVSITNVDDLAEWQSVFEKMRERRFGNYDFVKHPYD
jgi:hypothetical protein